MSEKQTNAITTQEASMAERFTAMVMKQYATTGQVPAHREGEAARPQLLHRHRPDLAESRGGSHPQERQQPRP